jgi:hypothetical protein
VITDIHRHKVNAHGREETNGKDCCMMTHHKGHSELKGLNPKQTINVVYI